jgi:Ca2+-binding RTX toxin-like protein
VVFAGAGDIGFLFGTPGADVILGLGFTDRLDLSALGPITWLFDQPLTAGPGVRINTTTTFFSGASARVLQIDLDGNGSAERGITLANFVGAIDQVAPGIFAAIEPLNFTGGAGAETIPGTVANDTIRGEGGADSLVGGLGNDSLNGGDGDDTAVGGAGADTLIGGIGNDSLRGDAGIDMLDGGAGDDILSGGADQDSFNLSGGGNDTIVVANGDLPSGFSPGFPTLETVSGFSLGDRLDFTGLTGFNFIGEGPFTGSAGQARMAFNFGTLELTLDLNGDAAADAGIALSSVSAGLELFAPGILGIAAPRNITGGASDELIDGAANADSLDGAGGADTLRGFASADTLRGGDGNDLLIGGTGDDDLSGGTGNDIFRYLSANDLQTFSPFSDSVRERINDFAAGDLIDLSAIPGISFIGGGTFSNVPGQVRLANFFFFSGGNQPTLQLDTDGNGQADRAIVLPGFVGTIEAAGPGLLRVAAPLDIVGDNTSESLAGGSLADTISGLGGNDTINGLDGADSLNGGAGSDSISGGDGADTIIGFSGADTMSGGAGVDRFVFANNATGLGPLADTILDFVSGIGELIDLFAVDANLDIAGNQAFTFIGSGPFTALAQLRFSAGVLQANVTGTTDADFEILLPGLATLLEADIVL